MSLHRLPPLKALPVFETVVRLGSISAAADELHLTTSAVSQQIRVLEDFFGQPLFGRNARGMTVTPEGRLFYGEVLASLERISNATQTLKATHSQQPLNVCTTPSLAMQWLIPNLPQFTAQHPGIDLRVTTATRTALERGDSDAELIILSHPLTRPGYTCMHFMADYCVPVAAPAFLREHRIEQPVDCLGYPLLQTVGNMGEWPQWFALAGVEVPALLPGPVFDHQFLCLQAAVNQLGIAMAPACLLKEELRSERLQPLFEQPQLPRAGLHLIYRLENAQPAQTRAFIAWLSCLT